MLIKPEIIYTCIPRGSVTIRNVDDNKYIKHTNSYVHIEQDNIESDSLLNNIIKLPVGIKEEENHRFWRDVQQLHFAFKDYDENRNTEAEIQILSFCNTYGNLLPRDFRSEPAEPWDECKKWLSHFHCLTTLADHVIQNRIPPLSDIINNIRSIHSEENGFREINLTEIITYGRHNMSISLTPWEEFQTKNPKDITLRLWPENDDELLYVIWNSVLNATLDMLQTLPLKAVGRDENTNKTNNNPIITWAFLPEGAIQAAFIQWYLQVIAGLNMNTCAADDCSKPLPRGRKKFCSNTCRSRIKKREQRLKKN